ncbi:hypothetical protein [Nocardia jiangxiensis]|uniref:hypothetical protein n=1 Tax=Nocardia jiangxiensis TaxID=282685 RepID=UPI001FE009D5|nr:hypothetical protein [Nocardia jiangxiensis]
MHWHKRFSCVPNWDDTRVGRWFGDGELNVADNYRPQRHGRARRQGRHPLEGEPGDRRAISPIPSCRLCLLVPPTSTGSPATATSPIAPCPQTGADLRQMRMNTYDAEFGAHTPS